jgi:hypothetical protein
MNAGACSFDTTVAGSGGKTGIEIPAEAIERLQAGRRPAVHVTLNGYEYRSTVAVMDGRYLVGVNAEVRAATGLRAGDPVNVTLVAASTPREVNIPEELAEALAADSQAQAFFDSLSNSLQRYHADTVAAAKSPETRRRRVERALDLFREGKKR